MSDRKHPYTPMQQTAYGYVCKTEQQIDGELERQLKLKQKRRESNNGARQGTVNTHQKVRHRQIEKQRS
ncbi:hypothetical protein EFM33_04020 [Lentilactobacillus buchneri]|nr:hypothetical protein [Lentilactobacillus buchneri]